MPKQVGLIIPRGPFLNLEWFVGLLEGDNCIHREPATGMHTRSTVECKCTLAQVHTYGCTCARTHTRDCSWTYRCTQTQTGGSESRTETGLGQAAESRFLQCQHSSVSLIPLRQPRECVCACLHVRASICLLGKRRERCVCVCVLECSFLVYLDPSQCGDVSLFRVCDTHTHTHTHTRKAASFGIYQSSSALWESQHGCGASPAPLTQHSEAFWLEKCQQFHSLQPWLTPTLSQPCRCRLAWYLLKFLWHVLNYSCYSRCFRRGWWLTVGLWRFLSHETNVMLDLHVSDLPQEVTGQSGCCCSAGRWQTFTNAHLHRLLL